MNHSADSIAPRTSFSSLPDDMILNCLARVSRIHYPTLFLVSKGFRSFLASPELHATRSRIGKTENFQYVCLNLNVSNPNPQWFILSPIPKQEKLLPIPSFPRQYPQSSTVVSSGSEIYIIGGYVRSKRSNKVFILDCTSHQWRRLPKMLQPRVSPAVDVIDGKIYVIGGCRDENIDNWGEVYDPKTQTWEPILPTTLINLTIQKTVLLNWLVMDEKVYVKDGLFHFHLMPSVCLVEIEKVLCLITIYDGYVFWRDPKKHDEWICVEGIEEVISDYFLKVVNSSGGRVTLWWKSVKFRRQGRRRRRTGECKTEIWCAEVSFEIRDSGGELCGFVEWSKNVLTFDGEIGNMLCQTKVWKGTFVWYDPEDNLGWRRVKGLEGLARNSDRRRVTVWWKSDLEIWCAEVSFKRLGLGELWGYFEWSNNVFTFDGCDDCPAYNFLLHSVIVTY